MVRLRVKVRTDVEISWHFVHPAQQEIPQLACPFWQFQKPEYFFRVSEQQGYLPQLPNRVLLYLRVGYTKT